MWLAVYGFWLLVVATVLAAWRWGSQTEQRVALAYLVAAIATLFVRSPGSSSYASLNVAALVVDLALLVVLLWILAKAPHWWLIGSAALQLVTVMGHVAMFDAPATRPLAYFMTVVTSSYPSQLLLAYAVIQTTRSRTASGPS